MAKGDTFKGYAEDLPSVGYTGATYNNYAEKHCPWVAWQGTGTNQIPSADNVPYAGYFPSDYTQLPTVSFVIPNQLDEMHSGSSIAEEVQSGDTWLSNYMNGYVNWAKTHNSLLILTWDEDGSDGQPNDQLVPTIFDGANIKAGDYSEPIDHYNMLSTLEKMYGLPYCTSNDQNATPITDVFTTPEPSTLALLAVGGFALLGYAWRRRRQIAV